MYILSKKTASGLAPVGKYETLDELAQGAADYGRLHHDRPPVTLTVVDTGKSPDARFTQVCAMAVGAFGEEPQLNVAIEELSELQKEICKRRRGMENKEHLAEEIADVEVMLEQMKIMFHIRTAVFGWRADKIERLYRRIEGRAKP